MEQQDLHFFLLQDIAAESPLAFKLILEKANGRW